MFISLIWPNWKEKFYIEYFMEMINEPHWTHIHPSLHNTWGTEFYSLWCTFISSTWCMYTVFLSQRIMLPYWLIVIKSHTHKAIYFCVPPQICSRNRLWENIVFRKFRNNIVQFPERHFVVSHTAEGKE